MEFRYSDLGPDERARYEECVTDLRERLLESVEGLLVDLDDERLAQHLYEVAFKPNDALPKRETRPTVEPVLLADRVHRHYAGDQPAPESLIRATVVLQEYYDVLDDLVDDDVAEGHEPQVLVCSAGLPPVLVGELESIGQRAVPYWRERALELVRAPLLESEADPSFEAYETLLDRQSALFGVVTGLAAIAAGADEDAVNEAERVGRLVFEHAQVVLDVEQHRAGDDDAWNALALASPRRVGESLRTWRSDVESLTEDYTQEDAAMIRALVAVDADELLAE